MWLSVNLGERYELESALEATSLYFLSQHSRGPRLVHPTVRIYLFSSVLASISHQ